MSATGFVLLCGGGTILKVLFQSEVLLFGLLRVLLMFTFLLTQNNPGRRRLPKQKRKKGVNESPTKNQPKHKKRTMHCGVCGVADHNSRFHKKKQVCYIIHRLMCASRLGFNSLSLFCVLSGLSRWFSSSLSSSCFSNSLTNNGCHVILGWMSMRICVDECFDLYLF